MIAGLAAVCLALSFFLSSGGGKSTAEVYSGGRLVLTIDLSENGTYRIDYGADWNLLTVRDGKLCVSSASCASQDCVRHGAANSGAPIVCLPNRLVIKFTDSAAVDAMLG